MQPKIQLIKNVEFDHGARRFKAQFVFMGYRWELYSFHKLIDNQWHFVMRGFVGKTWDKRSLEMVNLAWDRLYA